MADRSSQVFFTENSGAAFDSIPKNDIQNAILLALPPQELDALFSKLELVNLPSKTVLHGAGKPIKFAYFLNGGLASILTVMSNGKSVEVGLTGKEGFIGVPLLVGFRTSPNLVVMQVDGNGFRIPAQDLTDALPGCPALGKLLHRYAQELSMQAMHVAACNRLHEVEERLARWLLMSQDRLGGDTVSLTQESLAQMLGTRRASVTVAAGILQKAGSIRYRRGDVKIANRRKLEDAACECYGMMRKQSQKWKNESK